MQTHLPDSDFLGNAKSNSAVSQLCKDLRVVSSTSSAHRQRWNDTEHSTVWAGVTYDKCQVTTLWLIELVCLRTRAPLRAEENESFESKSKLLSSWILIGKFTIHSYHMQIGISWFCLLNQPSNTHTSNTLIEASKIRVSLKNTRALSRMGDV